MKECPVLFSAPMVLALLAGTKTQARQVVKPIPAGPLHTLGNMKTKRRNGSFRDDGLTAVFEKAKSEWIAPDRPQYAFTKCPYGQPGDRLWVREAWDVMELGASYDDEIESHDMVVTYRAGGPVHQFSIDSFRGDPALAKYKHLASKHRPGRWRPSIFMPRWAARIELVVESVRVERLQDISAQDAQSEGVERPLSPVGQTRNELALWRYKELWESINGPGSWLENPVVWVVEFRVVSL